MARLQVFSFWDSSNARPTVDIMRKAGIPFEDLRTDARRTSRTSSNCEPDWTIEPMKTFDPGQEPSAWGTFEDAEALRRWSFERRTPEQRLAWLKAALELAYQSGAVQPRRPDNAREPSTGR